MYIDLVTINLCPGQGGGGGVKPSGTLDISNNGVFDVYSYASANVNVPTGGYNEREVTEGKLNIVNLNNSASYVKNNVFDKNSYIQTVDLPDCYKVEREAFAYCANLTTVNLPVCSSLYGYAFRDCTSLSQVNIPECTIISIAAFMNCTSLSEIKLPVLQSMLNNVFSNCVALNSVTLCTDVYWTLPYSPRVWTDTPILSGTGSIYVRSDTYSLWVASTGWSSISSKFVSVPVSGPALSFSNGLLSGSTKGIQSYFTSYLSISKSDITNVSLPECRYIGKDAFAYFSTLNQVNLPECEYIDEFAFNNCNSLSQISLPVCEYIGEEAFQHCSLSQVSLPKCSYIGNGAFLGCINLMSITIGYSSVCNMNVTNIDAFENTYIGLGNGSIYVPASLVEAYKSAPFWSKYSSKIFPIS